MAGGQLIGPYTTLTCTRCPETYSRPLPRQHIFFDDNIHNDPDDSIVAVRTRASASAPFSPLSGAATCRLHGLVLRRVPTYAAVWDTEWFLTQIDACTRRFEQLVAPAEGQWQGRPERWERLFAGTPNSGAGVARTAEGLESSRLIANTSVTLSNTQPVADPREGVAIGALDASAAMIDSGGVQPAAEEGASKGQRLPSKEVRARPKRSPRQKKSEGNDVARVPLRGAAGGSEVAVRGALPFQTCLSQLSSLQCVLHTSLPYNIVPLTPPLFTHLRLTHC